MSIYHQHINDETSISFRNRFKGKTSQIGKDGVDAMIGKSSRPIQKTISPNHSYMHDSSYSFRSVQVNTDQDHNSSFISSRHERNFSQIHKLRKNFESERKAHRSNIFKNVFHYDQPEESEVGRTVIHDFDQHFEVSPKWGKNLVQKFDTKKKLIMSNSHNNTPFQTSQKATNLLEEVFGPDKWANVGRGGLTDEPKYDILILDRNNDVQEYEVPDGKPVYSIHDRLNRSHMVSISIPNKQKVLHDKYKPFTLRDYTKKAVEENLYLKPGGLGPNIGGKEWLEQKMKRDRIKEFSHKISLFKKDSFILKRKIQ